MKKILLVEDDRAVALAVIYSLKKEGFNVIHASSLREGREFMNDDVELVLLDLMLPDGDGYEFCEEIRSSGNEVGVIFMTACDEESNVVIGLNMGGDDYITKPVKINELVARINAVLRRKINVNSSSDFKVLKSENLEVDKAGHLVKKNGEDVSLTLNEYKLLVTLLENYPNVLTREMILDKIWDLEGNFIDSNAISVYMKRVRGKIEDDPKNPVLIGTVRGVGYKWNYKVVKE